MDTIENQECSCGWKDKAATTIELKNFDYPEQENDFNKSLAFALSKPSDREFIKELSSHAPSTKYGASRSQVSNYWMKNIRNILGKSS
jgi:hypothetical protein